jgi:CBS domain containing-hemolysin-like protein
VLHVLGRIPDVGDRIEARPALPPELAAEAEGLPAGVWVQVEQVDGTRVERALVGEVPATTGDEEDDDRG